MTFVRDATAEAEFEDKCRAVPGKADILRHELRNTQAKATLKRVLSLVLFLDIAKSARLHPADPTLFVKGKDYAIKSSKALVLAFGRRFLFGEGDIMRHLSFLDVSVSYELTAAEEFDYTTSNLVARLTEILGNRHELALAVPAFTEARQIVDGHRERTIALLWHMMTHWNIPVLVDEPRLRKEIVRINEASGTAARRRSLELRMETHLYLDNVKLQVLLDWTKAVCNTFGFKVANFTSSFADGRAFCLLVHYYLPSLLALDDIKTDDKLRQMEQAPQAAEHESKEAADG